MTLAIVGTGLVSPAGLTPREHAFVLWAGAAPPTASPFLLESGEPAQVSYCPWLGARMSMGDRLLAMAQAALLDALQPLHGAGAGERLPLLVCSEPERSGLSEAERRRVEHALTAMVPAGAIGRFPGAAGCFAALCEAEALIASGYGAVVIAALDSHVGEDALAEVALGPRSPWVREPPPPSEGAAALVVMDAAAARHAAAEVLGVVHYASTVKGTSNDDNDVPIDGAAMTGLLRRAPAFGVPAPLIFGQSATDPLRQAEWQLAVARAPARFHPEHELRCIEKDVGVVGAAAGAMNLVYGLAVARYRTTDMPVDGHDPFFAWAISRDGTRGLAAVSVKP
jgi:hypothetical protein